MKNKKLMIILFLSLVMVSQVTFALSLNLSDSLGTIGREIEQLIRNSYFRFGLTFILFFIIMYGLYSSAISRVTIFKGASQDKSIPNRQGKLISVSLALLTAVGSAYWANYSGREFTDRILQWAGWFGALAFGGIIALIAHFNSDPDNRDWKRTLALISLGLMVFYSLLGDAGWSSTWFTLFAIFGIWYLVQTYSKKGSGNATNNISNATGSTGSNTGGNTPTSRPSTVSNFNAKPMPSGISLSWNANHPSENIQGYQIQRSSNAGRFRFRPSRTWTVGANTTSTTDNVNYQNAQTYHYRIRAINQQGRRGPWTTTTATVGLLTISGRVIFDDGNEHPIDNVTVSLTGPAGTNAYHATTDGNGNFVISNVPSIQPTPLNVTITDNYPGGPVFQKRFPNAIVFNNINTHNVSFGNLVHGASSGEPIRMMPRNGVNSTLRFRVRSPRGGLYNQPLYVIAVGAFGNRHMPNIRASTNGYYILNNLPAGYAARLIIGPMDGSYPEAISGEVFLRRPNNTTNTPHTIRTPIQLPRVGNLSLHGLAYTMIHGNRQTINNTVVTAQDPSITMSSNPTGINGKYEITNMLPGFYAIRARHSINLYHPITDPVAANFPIVASQHRLDIFMIPTAPTPVNVSTHIDNTGRVILQVRI